MWILYKNIPRHLLTIEVKSNVQPVIHIAAPHQWASFQIHQFAVCACAEKARNLFPTIDFNWNH